MPKVVATSAETITQTIAVTSININLPVTGEISLYANFTKTTSTGDGTVLKTEQTTGISLSESQLKTLPVFATAYAQLKGLIYDTFQANEDARIAAQAKMAEDAKNAAAAQLANAQAQAAAAEAQLAAARAAAAAAQA